MVDELTPEELALAQANYAPGGPIAAAYDYLETLLGCRKRPIREFPEAYAGLWAWSDPDLRIARAQAWLWANRDFEEIRGHATEDSVVSLAVGGASEHPLWDSFAATELRQMLEAFGHIDFESVGTPTRPRLVAPDLELVLFLDTRVVLRRVDRVQVLPTVAQWLMRKRPEGWFVASHSNRLPEPGWPPVFYASE